MANNLNGVRIADNQTSGHHRTANEALDRIDGKITNTADIEVPDTNVYEVSDFQLLSNFRFEIYVGATDPTDTVDITLPNTFVRGLTFWVNNIVHAASIAGSAQTEPAVIVPPGGYALIEYDGTNARLANNTQPFIFALAASDESTALTTGTAKVTFRMPARVWLTEVRASLKTAQASGSILTVDINEGGTTILSTKLTVDNTEKTSTTAAAPAVISDVEIADDAEITIDIDQVGDGTAVGLKLTFIGLRY
jgi:hypothetical protein